MRICALFSCYLLVSAPGVLTDTVKQPPKKMQTGLGTFLEQLLVKIVFQGVSLKDNAGFLLPAGSLLPGATP